MLHFKTKTITEDNYVRDCLELIDAVKKVHDCMYEKGFDPKDVSEALNSSDPVKVLEKNLDFYISQR